ncbi:MAG: alpha/beta fold hydrolase [Rhodospirillaceae bacterium]|jgi:pimeloyl-[acyl-carrier protein] methyl ester esterase|nr:alpha/beta fold hydrolase [Rhodospirillaceae bacterium]MBT5373474.1 alpha/beta fold hydrolase [Rhodospirillaceae bacterium]MBT5658520.1 alpha/beta fold hydrolase [Rhodospirillaceae bacterium]MBT5752531.1 alpha/beta fold hydrolase [Rhodospirillaceae bacterium]
MTGPCLVLVHGWGFDASFWSPLCTALKGVETRIADLGFFGAPRVIDPPRDRPVIAIGHSLGLLWLLKNRPFAWQGLVSISGMPRFLRSDSFPHGVAPRFLDRMKSRFSKDPLLTLNEFRSRCGWPDDEKAPMNMDTLRLAEGLEWLSDWDVRQSLENETAPVLALAGDDDAIVPWALSQSVFGQRDLSELHCAKGGSHVLPYAQPQWCADRIDDFLGKVI